MFQFEEVETSPSGELLSRCFVFPPAQCTVDEVVKALTSRSAARKKISLGSLDHVFMRRTPLTLEVLNFAKSLEACGVNVMNSADSMLTVSHKGWLTTLTDVPSPKSLITASLTNAELFYERATDGVVLKPARGSGGERVQRILPGLPKRFVNGFLRQKRHDARVLIQHYLPVADEGEARVLWWKGQILGGYLRNRAAGEFRHNLKQGGSATVLTLSDAQYKTLQHLGPHLDRAGVSLAGVDMLGEYVVEANVVNPGGIYHTDRLGSLQTAMNIIQSLEDPKN